jgi:galactose mutarotase-like enzyme
MASFQRATHDGRWQELLQRGLEYNEWPCETDQRAPLLWPAAGRSFTRDQIAAWQKTGVVPVENRFEFAGANYAVGLHGFVRSLPWKLDGFAADDETAWAKCSLRSSPQTAAVYPLQFALSVTYRLRAGILTLEYEVTPGENASAMPFSIGNHLSLRMPFSKQGPFEDCTLRTPAKFILPQNPLCLLDGRRIAVDFSRPTSLERKEVLDTVLGGFKGDDAWVELRDPSSTTIRVSHREKSLDGSHHCGDDDVLFVFWGDAQQQYFCPEPWIGKPNSLNTGDGCIYLEPGQRFIWEIMIEVQSG